MNADAGYDILLEEAPTSLSRDDEISSRFPTNGELELLGVPETTPILGILSTVRDNNGKVLLFQDLARVSRSTLRYRYSFENRPKK
jgi:hypothetical protein